jgi:dihydroorotase
VALLLRGGRVVDPSQDLDRVCDVLIRDGVIVEIGEDLAMEKGIVVECAEKVVLPGLVDVHTHLREPGYEYKEDIESGTRAAAHGGFTAVCAMPNTNPVCDEGSAVRFVLERAAERGKVRVHPIGALTVGLKGESIAEIGDMVAAGAVAFSDDGKGVQDAGMMRRVMDYAKAFGTTVVAHCEEESLVGRGVVNEGVVSTRLGLPGWPSAGEDVAVARDIALAELTGCRLHLAHVSTAASLQAVREAKARGVSVTCEVTPHHLFLDEDALGSDYDTRFKMNPPLRSEADRQALLSALVDGTIDCVATDHAPHHADEKALEFADAPFGITGLETALSVLVDALLVPRVIGLSRLVELLSTAPARAFSLAGGTLAEGAAADVVLFSTTKSTTVTREGFQSRSANSPWIGRTLKGRVERTWVAGHQVYHRGAPVSAAGSAAVSER